MNIGLPDASLTCGIEPTHPAIAELEGLGDEIAELSAHLDAATARLLDLIREFDARGGWATASAPAPSGSPGAWGSIWARRVSASAWRAHWRRSRSWLVLLRGASSRTPRCEP